MDVNIARVYAINIQPSQIAKRLGCLLTDIKKIAAERVRFLEWLVSGSVFFENQVLAWDEYNNNIHYKTTLQNLPDKYFDNGKLHWEDEWLAIGDRVGKEMVMNNDYGWDRDAYWYDDANGKSHGVKI